MESFVAVNSMPCMAPIRAARGLVGGVSRKDCIADTKGNLTESSASHKAPTRPVNRSAMDRKKPVRSELSSPDPATG